MHVLSRVDAVRLIICAHLHFQHESAAVPSASSPAKGVDQCKGPKEAGPTIMRFPSCSPIPRMMQHRARTGAVSALRKLALLGAALLLAADAAALTGGAADSAGRFAAVVMVSAGGSPLCSATKIGPQRLLTAAHCTVDMASGAAYPSFAAGGVLLIGNAAGPQGVADLRPVTVRHTHLAPAFREGLERFQAYKRERIGALEEDFGGTALMERMRTLAVGPNFTARFPDVAVIELEAPLAAIPKLPVDLRPLLPEDAVTLVGYGCADAADAADPREGRVAGIRRFARSRVIRTDGFNVYTYARHLRTGMPSLCPGDSGGPVLRAGKVVGVHGSVHGYGGHPGQRGGHSNRAVQLHALRDWSALVK